MQTSGPAVWWAIGIGSLGLVAIAIAYIVSIVSNQRKFIREQQRQLEVVRQLTGRLQSIREEERTKIAREIHDELGQVLTVAKMYLTVLMDHLVSGHRLNGPIMAKSLKDALKIVDNSISLVKNIAYELRPIVLEDLGLKEAMEWEANQFEQKTGIRCPVSLGDDSLRMERDQEIAIFRIFQEALANVVRHANAQVVQVTMARNNSELVLDVTDNGRGITEEETKSSKSLGILGMRERALLLGGELQVMNANGSGTVVKLRIPLVKERIT